LETSAAPPGFGAVVLFAALFFVPLGVWCMCQGEPASIVGLAMALGMAFFWGVARFGKRFAAFGLSLVTIAAGITLVTVCIRTYGPHWSLAWNGERTEGKVSYVQVNGKPQPVVSYHVQGQEFQIAAKTDTQRHFGSDMIVHVVYQADRPDDAMIYSTEAIWVVPILATLVGVFFVGFGVIMFLGSIAPLVIRRIDKTLHMLEAKAAEYDDLPPHLR
jgi:hypothetical protein